MMAVIPSAKLLRRTNARLTSAREKELAQKQLALQENIKQHGLAGQKLGKHKVPEGGVDVQLGEELSESLRALKVGHSLVTDFGYDWLTDLLIARGKPLPRPILEPTATGTDRASGPCAVCGLLFFISMMFRS